MRWAVSQCVGQREGGRELGCARLLGGGELLKVQCESGDISHLLETLPNYLLEVPEIKAAGGESPSSYLRRRERETPQFLSCVPLSVSPSLLLGSVFSFSLFSLSFSVRGIKKIATSIMNFCSLSLLSTVPGILR